MTINNSAAMRMAWFCCGCLCTTDVCRIRGRKAARHGRALVTAGHQRARRGTRNNLRGPFGDGSIQFGSQKEASHDT